MNKVRITLGELFASPTQSMTIVSYMAYVNQAGKLVGQKTLIDLITVCLTYIEQLEDKNEQYEQNFQEIEAILKKLVDKKIDSTMPQNAPVVTQDQSKPREPVTQHGGYLCEICGKSLSTVLARSGHMRSHKPKEPEQKMV